MSDPKNVSGFRRALRHRGYATYIVGSIFSMSADWSSRIVVLWLTWELTESPAWLGVISFSDLAPTVLLSPVAGAFADRFQKLKLCRATASVSALAAIVLLTLYVSNALVIWSLLAVVLANGIGTALGQPARIAIVSNMVPRADLGPAIALSSVAFNMSRFSGPMLAGFLLYYLNPGWAFAVNACFQAVFVLTLGRVVLTSGEDSAPPRGSLIAQIAEGIGYTIRHPGIGPVMFLLVVSSVGSRPFMDLLPGFAASVFGRGPEALATMTSTVGLGAICAGTYLTMRTSIVGLTVIAVTAVCMLGVGLVAFASVTEFWFAIACLFLVGASMSTSATGVMTLVQASVEPSMRGRVLSLYGLIFRGGPALGSLTMGWAAQFVGLRWPVAIGAMLCVIMWAWTMRRIRTVARVLESEGYHGQAQRS
jgi:MFS family permease